MMCGCSLAAFVFIIGASYKGMPISGTHTVIGALIGSGIAGVGVGGIGWNKLVRVIMSWFISSLSEQIATLISIKDYLNSY